MQFEFPCFLLIEIILDFKKLLDSFDLGLLHARHSVELVGLLVQFLSSQGLIELCPVFP